MSPWSLFVSGLCFSLAFSLFLFRAFLFFVPGFPFLCSGLFFSLFRAFLFFFIFFFFFFLFFFFFYFFSFIRKAYRPPGGARGACLHMTFWIKAYIS
jgi:hypothetical protein